MKYRNKLRNNELEIDKQTNLGEEGLHTEHPVLHIHYINIVLTVKNAYIKGIISILMFMNRH